MITYSNSRIYKKVELQILKMKSIPDNGDGEDENRKETRYEAYEYHI